MIVHFARMARRASTRLLTAALVALLMIKAGATPTSFLVGALESCSEIDEQEGNEPDESEGGPHVFQLCVSRTVTPRAESCLIQRLSAPPAVLRPGSRAEVAMPIELARRNGIGAPLRC